LGNHSLLLQWAKDCIDVSIPYATVQISNPTSARGLFLSKNYKKMNWLETI